MFLLCSRHKYEYTVCPSWKKLAWSRHNCVEWFVKTVYGLPSMTLNLFTNSNQLIDSLTIGAKSSFSFINIKRGKEERPQWAWRGDKSLFHRDSLTLNRVIHIPFSVMAPVSKHALDSLVSIADASSQVGLTELVGTEPTSRIE